MHQPTSAVGAEVLGKKRFSRPDPHRGIGQCRQALGVVLQAPILCPIGHGLKRPVQIEGSAHDVGARVRADFKRSIVSTSAGSQAHDKNRHGINAVRAEKLRIDFKADDFAFGSHCAKPLSDALAHALLFSCINRKKCTDRSAQL